MKACELCNFPARVYCESDQANLCCDCDSKVHSANFLVEKHSRTLLCHTCQSPTPWTGSGPKLGPTVSVCQSCANRCTIRGQRGRSDNDLEREDDIDDDDDEDEDDDDGEDNDDDDDDDEDEENQVVPWSSTPPPAPVSSSSTSEETSSRLCRSGEGVSESKTEGASSSQQTHIRNAALPNGSASTGFFRVEKDRERRETTRSGAKALVESLKRLQRQSTVAGDDNSMTILGICNLSKASGDGDGVF